MRANKSTQKTMQFNVSVLLLSLLYLSKCCLLYGQIENEAKRPREVEGYYEDEDEFMSIASGLFEDSTIKTVDSIDPEKKLPKPQTYGVIVDCGSSGTRAHIYQWDTELQYPELLKKIAPMRNESTDEPLTKKFTPGLSSLASGSTEKVHKYIKEVADYLKETIPNERHNFTWIYILATAGMRLLGKADQERIMNEVQNYVKANYNFRDVSPSVISGSHEGMYQWISVNTNSHRFMGNDTDEKTKTYGVIEMGGASVQVTFHLRKGVKDFFTNTMKPHLRDVYMAQLVTPLMSQQESGENFTLHSTTFLGFGSNSAREAYLDLLIKKHYSVDFIKKFIKTVKDIKNTKIVKDIENIKIFKEIENLKIFKDIENKRAIWYKTFFNGRNTMKRHQKFNEENGKLVLVDPCTPRGYTTQIIKKPKRMLDSKKKIGFIVTDDEPTFDLQIEGMGNYRKCRQYVQEMLKLAKEDALNCKEDELCTMSLIGEKFIPFAITDFLGIGDLYYTSDTMLNLAGFYHHGTVVRRTQKICETDYQDLWNEFKNVREKNEERLHSQCFKAVWMDTFLTKGLRMPNRYKMFRTVGEIEGKPPEWSLAAVLDRSLSIGVQAKVSPTQNTIADENFVEETTVPTEEREEAEETTEAAEVVMAPTVLTEHHRRSTRIQTKRGPELSWISPN